LGFFLLAACSGPGVLRPDGILSQEETPPSRSFTRLQEKLRELGYDAVGMQYETDSTLDFLFQVFSDRRAAGRKIKLVYTGLYPTYDASHQSMTIGGGTDAAAVLDFVIKKIPLR